MPPLQIDFVRRPPVASALGWLLLLCGLAGIAVVLADTLAAREQLRSAQEQLDRQTRHARAPAPRRAVPMVAPERQRSADRASAALQRPWGDLLLALEAQTDSRVAVLALQGNGEDGSLRLSGEARSMKDVAAYLERLRGQPALRSVVLSSHEGRSEAGVGLVRFTLDAQWGDSGRPGVQP